MQNYIIRYVEDLKARIEPTGCSIAKAIEAELPKYEDARLLKLRDAGIDLVRIVTLEMDRRQDAVEDARKFYIYGEDLVDGLTGPFDTRAEAEEHVRLCESRGDADPGKVITGTEAQAIVRNDPGILVLTPEEDRAMLCPVCGSPWTDKGTCPTPTCEGELAKIDTLWPVKPRTGLALLLLLVALLAPRLAWAQEAPQSGHPLRETMRWIVPLAATSTFDRHTSLAWSSHPSNCVEGNQSRRNPDGTLNGRKALIDDAWQTAAAAGGLYLAKRLRLRPAEWLLKGYIAARTVNYTYYALESLTMCHEVTR